MGWVEEYDWFDRDGTKSMNHFSQPYIATTLKSFLTANAHHHLDNEDKIDTWTEHFVVNWLRILVDTFAITATKILVW